jgi:hypothetical protein
MRPENVIVEGGDGHPPLEGIRCHSVPIASCVDRNDHTDPISIGCTKYTTDAQLLHVRVTCLMRCATRAA